jgi:HAD superfamily hydrolase (TIGR01549 family)
MKVSRGMKERMDVAVLFDLEDTLVQTPWSNHQHVLEFRCSTRQKLIDLEIPKVILEGIESYAIMRNAASKYVEKHFAKAEAERFQQEMEKFLDYYERDSAKKSKLFPETIPCLEALRRLGAKIGLITNTSRKVVNTVFEIHDMKNCFEVIITREDVKRLKPYPDGILSAVSKLSIKRFFMVGDLALDVMAAKKAGGLAILVRRDYEQAGSQGSLKNLKADVPKEAQTEIVEKGHLQADYVIQSLLEVPAIVQAEEAKIARGKEDSSRRVPLFR